MLQYVWLGLGRWLEAKRLPELAETCLRIASQDPGRAGSDSLMQLARRRLQADRAEEAAELARQATQRQPLDARAWNLYGAACRRAARMEDAGTAYRRALELDPAYEDARCNLGEWHLMRGQPDEALRCFDAVLAANPRHYQAHTNRIAALLEAMRIKEAQQAAADALKLYPDSPPLLVNLGNVYCQTGKGREAANAYRKALEIDPGCDEAALSFAALTGATDALDRSDAFLRRQIAVRGETTDLLGRLALTLMGQKRYHEAREVCDRILERQPRQVVALVTTGNVLSTLGDSTGAIRHYEQAVEAQPELSSIYSNVLFEANYLGEWSREEIFARHREWARRYEAPLLTAAEGLRRGASFDRGIEPQRLKVGYVSADFVAHPVGFLLRDVLRNHDRMRVEVFCYSQVTVPDDVTAELRGQAEHWRETFFEEDDALAQRIADDGIHVLVDLSGHTAGNRLKAFALRPAPVQATWIGYFHSTGLRSIDYFITDPVSTPPGSGQLFSETPAYLPDCRWCYSPPDYAPAVAAPPSAARGHVTFGSFNRLSKITDRVIACWAAILRRLPEARLVLKTYGLHEAETARALLDRFAAAGVDAIRVELRGTSAHPEMLRQYGDVDIALDPFPFNGGMTTLESLWMGVPVIALAGDAVVSRQTAAVLSAVGLAELAYDSVAAYVEGAVVLARDGERLGMLRRGMRGRLLRSPLIRADQFVANLELLYRRMWEAYCTQTVLPQIPLSAEARPRRTLLHVGCGAANIRNLPAAFRAGWDEIRLDADETVCPDVLGTAIDMHEIPTASVDAVFSSHTLEHLYAHEVPQALAEMRRVLRPGGFMIATVPDIQSAAQMVAEDRLFDVAYQSPAGPITPFDILYSYRGFVGRDRPYMAHHGGFTLTTLQGAIRDAGFATVTGFRRTDAFDLWVLAAPDALPDEETMRLAARYLPDRPTS